MGPLADTGLSIGQLAYAETLRLLGLRAGELVMGVIALIGLVAGMAYVLVSLRLASVMERVKQS